MQPLQLKQVGVVIPDAPTFSPGQFAPAVHVLDASSQGSIAAAEYLPDHRLVRVLDTAGYVVIYPLHVIQFMRPVDGAELEPKPRRSVR